MSHAVRSRFARTFRPELLTLEERTLPAVIANLASPHQLDSILVQFKSPAQAESFNAAGILRGVTMSKELAPVLSPGLRQLSFDPALYSVPKVLTAYGDQPAIGYAAPNYTYFADVVPNDTNFGSLWGMNNTGQTGGTVDADIDAPEAWDTTVGSGNFIIADIDTGVDYNHPDLAANMWTNPRETPGNGVDDDNNGFIDDVHGYDFVNNDGDPMDDHGHGTHTSGTIGAVGNNNRGVAGVNWNVKIMALKFLSASGSGSTANAVRALNYAVMMNVKVSSNSWGGGGFDNSLNNALTAARNAGHIFVAAAGNSNSNNDVTPNYPSNYPQDNIIAVAATDANDNKASFSSYGKTTVDLAAPGVSILSTIPNNQYANFSGTSMATPHVAGAVALVWDMHPNLTYQEVIQRILTTVDVKAQLANFVATSGRLNLKNAVFNGAPAGLADSYTTSEDTTLNISAPGVLSNDTDPDKDTLRAVLNAQASNGTVTLNQNGSFTYVPNANFFGSDSFKYVANDGRANSSPVTVNLTVTAVNDAPVAVDDAYSVLPGGTLNIAAPGVLTNDTDIDSPPSALQAVLVTGPAQGTLTLNADGSFTYVAPRRPFGTDTFQYRAFDGFAQSNLATVTIRSAQGSPPISQSDTYTTMMNTPVSGNVLTNDSDPDGDPLTAILVLNPLNGSLVLNADGTFTYTPNAGFTGVDSFSYKANDGLNDGNTVKVGITVSAAPVTNPDSYKTNPGRPLNIAAPGVLANDTSPGGGALQAELVQTTTQGTLILQSDGSFVYLPNVGFIGTDTFQYRATDGTIPGNTATVTLLVGTPPSAVPDQYTTNTITLSVPAGKGVLINDYSPNNSPLTARLNSGPSVGTLTLNADGSFDFTAPGGFTGTATFTYIANDGVFDSNVATVSITVTGANSPPVAVDNAYTVLRNRSLAVVAPGILANDHDPDNNPLVAVLQTDVTNGTLTLLPNGAFFYSPNLNFLGQDSFTYVANDGTSNSNVATVTIDVVLFPPPPPIPNPTQRVVMAQEVGGQFKVFSGQTGQEFFSVSPFANFTGSVRIATADFNGDNVPDIFAAPGPQAGTGTGLRAKAFDGNTGQLLPGPLGFGVAPFGVDYRGGMQVATGDVTGDGKADVILAADSESASPQVRVYDGVTGGQLSTWLGGFSPYTALGFGGVRVAVGDVTGDGRADIITSPGAGSPTVKVFNSASLSFLGAQINQFDAYTSAVAGGVYVAAGDLDGDGKAEIVTGAASNPNDQVRLFDGLSGTFLRSFNVSAPVNGPVRVAVGDIDGNGKRDLVVGAMTTGFASRGRVYDATTLQEMLINPGQLLYGNGYNDALFVAALNK